MWALLRWLYGVAEKVYAFFGKLYYKIKSAALNAWGWAQSAKNKAITWAQNTILRYYDKAKSWVNTYIKPIAQAAWNKAVEAANSVSIWFNDLKGKVIQWIDNAKVDVRQWVNKAVHDTLEWIEDVKGIFKRAIRIVEAWVQDKTQQVTSKIDELFRKVAYFIEPSTVSLMEQVKASWGVLSTIIDNPLEWIAAYLGSIILPMLEYKIAYALGTEKAILPPPPDWNGGGGGGPFPRGPGPAPGASPLAPPLSYLSVSGYRFGPGHWATDFGCTDDMEVYACHDGKVKVAGFTTIGYGNYVVIQSGEWWTLYAHLSRIFARVGQAVKARTPIGVCGCVGNSTCNHLHLEIKHYGQYIDPVMAFGL